MIFAMLNIYHINLNIILKYIAEDRLRAKIVVVIIIILILNILIYIFIIKSI